MVVKEAIYAGAMATPQQYPGGTLPEFAFAGKSNVGKSSLINLLTGRTKLARVSKQPGKTRLIHFFHINGVMNLVDLPGYGYARVSKDEKRSWDSLMEGYFEATDKLILLLILVDIRHDPTEGDLQMVKWADHYNVPFLVVATKADKVAKSKRAHAALKLAEKIAGGTGIRKGFDIVPVSSLNKAGRDDVLEYMEKLLPADGES